MRHLILPCTLALWTLGGCTSAEPCNEPARDVIANDWNENGVDDAEDIAAGTSLDENQNGIPDEVEQGLRGR